MNADYLAACCLAGMAVLIASTAPLALQLRCDREDAWRLAVVLAFAASVTAVVTMAVT